MGAARITPAALVRPARKLDEAEVVAVAARDRERAGAFAKKHGIPPNSGALHGYRYNASVLVQHLAEEHFGAAGPSERHKSLNSGLKDQC